MYWTDRMVGRVFKCNKFDCVGRNVVVSFILRFLGIVIMYFVRQVIFFQGQSIEYEILIQYNY